MKYFLHDTSAFNDEKITQLYMNFGYEGIGLFFTILEKLALQEKPVNTDVLKHQLNVGKKLEKCWKFMESIELICSNNGETFNKQLLNFSEKYKIKSEKNAKRISEWRKNQDSTKKVTRYKSVSNEHKVNKIEVNRIESINKTLLSEINVSDVPDKNKPYFDIAKSFYELFKENISESGGKTNEIEKTTIDSINQIRLIIEADKHTIDDLRAVYVYLKNEIPDKNGFAWKKNIFSMATLRKQMNKLKIKITSNNSKKNGSSTSTAEWKQLADMLESKLNN